MPFTATSLKKSTMQVANLVVGHHPDQIANLAGYQKERTKICATCSAALCQGVRTASVKAVGELFFFGGWGGEQRFFRGEYRFDNRDRLNRTQKRNVQLHTVVNVFLIFVYNSQC